MDEAFEQYIQRASVLVEALPYLQEFRGKTMVIKYGGSAMDDPALVESALRDIVFLENVGINPVVVHGGGKAISSRMKEAGLEATFVGGLRVTDERSISLVEETLNRVINPGIVARMRSLGGRAESFRGQDFLRARRKPPVLVDGCEQDLGYVGDVIGCRVLKLIESIREEVVPVISPLGMDENGQIMNVNADIAAAEIGVGLEAHKIIYLSDVNGILRDASDPSTRIPTVNAEKVAQLKDEGVITGGMLPKVESCLKALSQGVGKVHLIDGRIPHALLLELLTDRGIGTEIVL
ncbi:MAG: acetylglutamate kinase [Candidatus Methylacidiphilales bacterium]